MQSAPAILLQSPKTDKNFGIQLLIEHQTSYSARPRPIGLIGDLVIEDSDLKRVFKKGNNRYTKYKRE